jgi:hypothetical protein
MGVVYRGRDRREDRTVAIKFARADEDGLQQRFAR